MSKILVVDDEPADLNLVRSALEKLGHEVVTAESARGALKAIHAADPDVAVLDVMLPDGNGLDILERIRKVSYQLPVVFVTAGSESQTAIQAMKLGALDYLVKPIDIAELRNIVERALEIRRLTDKPIELNANAPKPDSQLIVGRCQAMQEVYKAIGIVADQDVTVLIRGESGTGKELVARALYQHSDRVKGPFLAVNCAAIPEALLESELFGHERGAFTGADRQRIGKFEQCGDGTLFLDEIGDMSPVLQSKMLRVLQEKQFERVGGNETITSDVRLIAATNRDLETMVSQGEFRADLYYRLNGFSIHLPPLRERDQDIDLLVERFRLFACHDLDKSVTEVSPEAMRLLRRYNWPGNIRELQNVVRQAVLKTNGPVLTPDGLPSVVVDGNEKAFETSPNTPVDSLDNLIDARLNEGSESLYDDIVRQVEQRLVEHVLQFTRGNKSEAVRRLGVNPSALRSEAALALLDVPKVQTRTDSIVISPGTTMAEIEKEVIIRTLEQTKGCRKDAASLLGISARTMQRRVKELNLE